MRYHVLHTTTYTYSEPVSLCQNQAHLAPLSRGRQHCESNFLTIDPPPACMHSWHDYFGNQVQYFTLETPHSQLAVIADSIVEVREPEFPLPAETPAWEAVRERLAAAGEVESLAASQFAFESTYIRRLPEAHDFAVMSFPPQRPILEGVVDLTTRIYRQFKYDPAATVVNTPTAEVMRKRRGVCQDFAHLQITCLRSLGLAARYVSGYLLTEPPPGQPKLMGADASHAWVSVWVPGSGWIDFDPTNNQMPSLRHVTLAWGRDYGDVCPVKGILLGGGSHVIRVAVNVAPV